MALELWLGPVTHLIGQQSCFWAKRGMPGVMNGSRWRGELVLIERWRVLGRAGLMAVELQHARRRGRVMALRRGH